MMRVTVMFIVVTLILIAYASQNAVLAQSPSEFVAMTDSEQDALIKRFVTNAINSFASKTDSGGQPKSKDVYETQRAVANLTRALFFPDSKQSEANKTSDPPVGYAAIRQAVVEAARRGDKKSVVEILSEYVTSTYDKYKKDWLPERSDANQEQFFRFMISYDKYEDSYNKYEATYNIVALTHMSVAVDLELKRLALEESPSAAAYEAEKAKIEAVMKDFIDIYDGVIKGSVKRLVSPTDAKTGQPKSPNRLETEKRRAKLLQESSTKINTNELALRIHRAMKGGSALSPQNLYEIIVAYLIDEVKKWEAGAQSVPK